MQTVEISNYGQYTGDNYGAHTLRVDWGIDAVWFSYRTPVAFLRKGKVIVRRNEWGPTTGKHLNWIDDGDKASRIDGAEFERQLAEMIEGRIAVTV